MAKANSSVSSVAPSHTPGPWHVSGSGDSLTVDYRHDYSHDAKGIGTACGNICVVDGNSGETNHANACLIAAAPELLEALKELLPRADRGWLCRSSVEGTPCSKCAACKAEAAIAKAERAQ